MNTSPSGDLSTLEAVECAGLEGFNEGAERSKAVITKLIGELHGDI